MRGNSNRCDARFVDNALRKAYHVGARVIIIGKLARYADDADIGNAARTQHGIGSARAGHADSCRHL